MKPYQASESRIIQAAPEHVYGILADYRDAHPRILPKLYFGPLEVERGGVGEDTLIRFEMQVFGKSQKYRAIIKEPERGRQLDEIYLEPDGVITRFFVEPSAHANSCKVTITTEGKTRGSGVTGWLERLLATTYLRRVFRKELDLLTALAEGNHLPRKSS